MWYGGEDYYDGNCDDHDDDDDAEDDDKMIEAWVGSSPKALCH